MRTDPEVGTLDGEQRRLLLLDQVRQTERRAMTFQVASVMAHLIGTPLNVIAGRAALLRANPTPESCEENSRRIEEQVNRLAQRIRRLIDFLTLSEPAAEPLPATTVLDETMSLCESVGTVRGVAVKRRAATVTGAVEGVPALVILTSLVSLSTRLAGAGDTVEIGVSETNDGPIRFEVTLPGMPTPPRRLDRLEPAELNEKSEDDAERSEELQVLSVCFAMARRHGGALGVSRVDGSGTTAVLECVRIAG